MGGVWVVSRGIPRPLSDPHQTPTRSPPDTPRSLTDLYQTPPRPFLDTPRHRPDPSQTPTRHSSDPSQTSPRRWIPISRLGLSLLLPGFQNPYVHEYVVCWPLKALFAGHIDFLVIWGLIGQLPSCANLKCLLTHPCSTENQREIYMK